MNTVIVTTSWDDGHVLDLKLAELLQTHRLAGTFYISPEDREIPADKRLTKEQLIQLDKNFEIGAHTVTHPRLSMVSDTEAQKEITDSKQTLQTALGHPVTSFCYPGGDYLPKHEAMVQNAGFKLARTVERGATTIGTDPFAIPTTVHAYQHLSDFNLLFSKKYFNWDDLAISMFDKIMAEGGVFHLWGHSWEIDKNGDWERLERVFKYIANRPDVRYLTNGQLI